MRSDASTPPGSRIISAMRPRLASSAARPSASVDLPAPSRPSIVISLPRLTGQTLRWPAMALADLPAALEGLDAHPHARALLGSVLGGAHPPSHAYLFHGPPGTGKRTIARAFAAALLAHGAADPEAVAERVARGSHPDLTWVTPSGAAEMLVSDIDEAVVAAAARTPFEAARRVVVIEDADAPHQPAANRLPKPH